MPTQATSRVARIETCFASEGEPSRKLEAMKTEARELELQRKLDLAEALPGKLRSYRVTVLRVTDKFLVLKWVSCADVPELFEALEDMGWDHQTQLCEIDSDMVACFRKAR